ncbi:CDGSH iron-sulfur domain-containing protein [Roseospirillum parvum]|uniref:Iron-binding zinc finger CDGSH type n=1 Tax=Roseospirillum parvum TaxID=83401 RepID=A0A1G8FIZ4_9PROT|nr:CDGSH iron-sulfur domain-containing protein [Roseospirillum parvum]SDH82081.1 Iron-binding zinc finger CDGSH type [Roseospirillum parvum]
MSQDDTPSGPFVVRLRAGQKVFWCACGHSKKQPFCDGAHKGSGLAPLPHKAERAGEVAFCGCKRTATPPLCDGSHDRV